MPRPRAARVPHSPVIPSLIPVCRRRPERAVGPTLDPPRAIRQGSLEEGTRVSVQWVYAPMRALPAPREMAVWLPYALAGAGSDAPAWVVMPGPAVALMRSLRVAASRRDRGHGL